MRWMITIVGVAVLIIALAVGVLVVASRSGQKVAATQPAAPTPDGVPATQATTRPKTAGTSSPRVQTYTDLLHTMPGMADATLADERLPIPQAAVLRLPYHAYICRRHDLWIAHPEAPSTTTIEQDQLIKQTTHLARERVAYVHWQRIGRQVRCTPVYRDELGAYRLALPRGASVKLERFDYHWHRALNSGDTIIAPTDQGVAVITIKDKEVTQQYRQISRDEQASPEVAVTGKGFIAWLPPTFAAKDEGTVLRYADGQFVEDFAKGPWAGPFLHLVPFTDGNILQIAPAKVPGKVRLGIVPLETASANPAAVQKLLMQLADEDGAARSDAHATLAAMGPSAWDVIEKSLPSLPLEARARAEQIIAARVEPRLGRFGLVDDALRPVWRLSDGGVVMLAEQGVMTTRDDPSEIPTVPAWVCIRPGYPITLLPPALTRSLAIGTLDLDAVGSDWVISDEGEGARIFFGQELQPITREADRKYRHVVGVDNDGRILLASTSADTAARAPKPDYLLIDPRVADPTPMLPVWTMTVPEGETGWDGKDWPAVKRGQPWALHEDGWEGLTGEILKSVGAPGTITAGEQALVELASDPAKNTFFSNRANLAVRAANGKITTQPRPAGMPNTDLASVYCRDRLFILHPQGKLSRLKVDPQATTPFTVDAIFAKDVPSVSKVNRMWVDPAGRICIAADEDRVIIIFAGRKIPQAIQDIIPEDELKQARP